MTKFNRPVKIISAGEIYVASNGELAGTLLGACVSVVLIDKVVGLAGLNHYVYPGKINSYDRGSNRNNKYGVNAINNLLFEMLDSGAKLNNMKAHVFGGGVVVDSEEKHINNEEHSQYSNVSIAKMLLELEDIEILSQDVGGNFIRKVVVNTNDFKIYLKKKHPEERGIL